MGNRKVRYVEDILILRDTITRPADTTAYTTGDSISNVDDSHFTFSSPAGMTIDAKWGQIIKMQPWSNETTARRYRWLLSTGTLTTTADNLAVSTPDAEVRAAVWCDSSINSQGENWGGSNRGVIGNDSPWFRLPLVNGAFDLEMKLICEQGYTPLSAQQFMFEITLMLA